MSNEVVGATLAPITDATEGVLYPTDDVAVIIRSVSLIVLLVISLGGNVLVVLSVAQSATNRHIPLNAFILSMASYGLLECALTMSLSIGFSVERGWKFGDFLAGFNASFVQLQNVGVMLTLVAMSIDRYIAVTRVTTYHTHSSVHHANYVVLYTWIHAFIFSLPLLFQNQMLGITCRAFVERCLCGLVEGTSLPFTLLLGILCFLIPFALFVVFISLVACKASKEKKRLKELNSAAYANYCLQESMVLNEARYCGYVALLFFLYLIFKAPYVFVDISTQLNFSPAFEPISANNITLTVDGTKFYYQTAFSLMMFCFSSIFPVITFMQFPEHWRKTKSFLTCGHVSATSSNRRERNAINQRNLRQKQRRQRHQQRRAREIARKRQQNSNMSSRKAPSSVSSNITSEKVAVNGAMSGEMFRVPVLYPATDGLHLVASGKTLQAKKKKISSSSVSSTNNNNNMVDGVASLPRSKSTMKSRSQISQPSGDVIDDFRPSSVIDKRVDVFESRDCLQINQTDEVYIGSDFDADEDTESELNTSANSRTLIWPDHQRSGAIRSASAGDILGKKAKLVWNDTATSKTTTLNTAGSLRRSYPFEARCESSATFDSYQEYPPHPHTPTPPPDEDQDTNISSVLSYIDHDIDPSGEKIVDKNNFSKIKLPTLKNRNISTVFVRASNMSSRREPLLSNSVDEHFVGQSNEGYESPSALFSRRSSDASVVIKQTSSAFSHNKVHPDQMKAFYPGLKDYAIHSTHLEKTGTHQSTTNDALSGLVYAKSQDFISRDYVEKSEPQRPFSSNHKILKVTPAEGTKSHLRAVSAHSKSKRAAPAIPDIALTKS